MVEKELVQVFSSDGVCDFCGDPNVVRVFYCPDFRTHIKVIKSEDPLPVVSKGNYFSCKACAENVDNNNMECLIDRCIEAFEISCSGNITPMARSIFKESISCFHREFLAHYTGSDSIDEC